MSLVYLYAIVPAKAADWLAVHELRGIAGGQVTAVVEQDIAGAVGGVPAAEFEQEPLDRNVSDATWLGPRAAAHQEVNAALLEALGAVVPLAFGSIFRGSEGVRRTLRDRHSEFAEVLDAVEGRAEWVVTLERPAGEAAIDSPVLRSLRAEADGSAPGRAYLLRGKIGVAERDERRRLEAEALAELRSALAFAEAITDEPVLEGGPVARLTVFAPRDREAMLREAIDRLPGGYTARVSGPWPAYRYGARLGRFHG